MNDIFNLPRCARLAYEAVQTFGLDLAGRVVLTEAATGYYALTAPLAALGGSERVYCLTRDSRYASAGEAVARTRALAEAFGRNDSITVLSSRDDPRIGEADIVMNLGFVRPLEAAFLRRIKRTAVIPLMFETWEWRPEDVDLSACRELGIPVAGTNEHHSVLQTIEYVGTLAVKLLLELQVEITRSRILVMGEGRFAGVVGKRLRGLGADVLALGEKDPSASDDIRKALKSLDAMVVAAHESSVPIIAEGGLISAERMRAINPSVVVSHISGRVDQGTLDAAGVRYNPPHLAAPRRMSVATDYLGPRPLIELHAAGLRVGQELLRAVDDGFRGIQAVGVAAARNPLVQSFDQTTINS